MTESKMSPFFGFLPRGQGHVKVKEIVDVLAKGSIKHETVDIQVPLCRAEIKTIIKGHTNKLSQEYSDIADTGQHLYNVQKQVEIF